MQRRNKKRNKEGEDDEVVDDRKKLLLEKRTRKNDDENENENDDDDDDDGGNYINSNMEYDGVTKLAEVYANELRLSAQLEARELRKHRRYDLYEHRSSHGQRRAFPENDGMVRRRRDQWGFEAIKSDLELRKFEHQNTMASERLAARRMNEVHKSTNAAAVRALVYASCLALCGVVGGSVCASAFLDIASLEDLRDATKRNFEPTVLRIRERVDAYITKKGNSGEVMGGGISRLRESMSGKRASFLDKIEESEFVLALRRVFRMKEKKKPPPS